MIKGTTFLVGARLIVRTFSLLNIVVLARLLTPIDYGIAALAIAAVAVFTTFSDLKIYQALIASDEVDADHLNTAFTLSLLRGLLIAGLMFGFAGLIATAMDAPRLAPVLRTLSLVFIFDGLCNPAFWMYQRAIDFSKEFGRSTIAQAIASIVTISAAFYFRSYWAIVAGTLTTVAANMALSYWRVPFRPHLGLRYWREFCSFGGWLTLQGMAAQVGTLAPRLLIPKILSPAALGVYTISREAVSLPLEELLGPLRRTFLPSFSAIKDDPERLRRTVRLAMSALLGVALPVGVGLALFAREILTILVGPQWLAGAVVLQLVAVPMAMLLSSSPIIGLATALGELKLLFVRSLVLAIIAWASVYIGLTSFGFDGGIAALAVHQLLALVANLGLLRRLTAEPVHHWFTDSWRSFASAAVMALVLSLLLPAEVSRSAGSIETLAHVMPQVLAGGFVYTAVHLLLWRWAGRPDGFESNVLHYAQVLSAGMRWRLSR